MYHPSLASYMIPTPSRREGTRVFFEQGYQGFSDANPFRFDGASINTFRHLTDMGLERFEFQDQNCVKFSCEEDAVICFIAMSK